MGCIFVALNAKLWKISVNGDKLVVCRVARSPIEVDIHAIEYAELKHTCINVYMSGKKQLGVTRGVDGFWRLCDRLNELGKMHPSKMDPTQNRDFFSIKRNRVGWLVFSGIVVIVFGAGLVMMFLSVLVIKPEETSFFFMDVDAIFYGIVCMCVVFILGGVFIFVDSLRWKLMVEGNELICRSAFKPKQTIPISSIERVNFGSKDDITLIYNEKKLITVSNMSKGAVFLVERLQAEQVAFYRNKTSCRVTASR